MNHINTIDQNIQLLSPIYILNKNDYYNGFLQLLEQLTVVNSNQISYANFCEQYDNLKNEIYIIKNNLTNKIVATGSIFIEPKFIRNLSSVAHIEDIVVDKEYRGYGLGKLIINYLTNIAKDKKCYKVILDCSDDNIGFYENCGFTKKGNEMALYF